MSQPEALLLKSATERRRPACPADGWRAAGAAPGEDRRPANRGGSIGGPMCPCAQTKRPKASATRSLQADAHYGITATPSMPGGPLPERGWQSTVQQSALIVR
jgi:hypothetical protein